MKNMFNRRNHELKGNNPDLRLKEEYDQKLDAALNAQAKGELSKHARLLKESQQIFVKWAEEVKSS